MRMLALAVLIGCGPKATETDDSSTPDTDTEDSGDTDVTWTWGTDNDGTVADATLVGSEGEFAGGCLLGAVTGDVGDDLLVGAPDFEGGRGRVYGVPFRSGPWTRGESLDGYSFVAGDAAKSQLCRAVPGHFEADVAYDYVLNNGTSNPHAPGLIQVVRGGSWTTSLPVVATIDNVQDSTWLDVHPWQLVGDLDGDGLDELFLKRDGTGDVVVLSGSDVHGAINAPDVARLQLESDGTTFFASDFGDLDGDGLTDFIMTHQEPPAVHIVSGAQTGGPLDIAAASMTTIACEERCWTTSVGDIDSDGIDDLWLDTTTLGGFYFLGRSDWPTDVGLADADLTAPSTLRPLTPVGDLDGDGIADFAQADIASSVYDGDTLLWWGGGSWPSELTAAGADVVIHGGGRSDGIWSDPTGRLPDIDGDGRTDLVLSSEGLDVGPFPKAGAVAVYTGRNSWPATLTSADADVRFVGRADQAMLSFGGYGYWMAILDLNADGADDLALFDYGGPGDLTGATALFFGKPRP